MPRSDYLTSKAWGNLQVSFELPRSAAKKLHDLAVIGDRRLNEIGILKVQIKELEELAVAGNVGEKQGKGSRIHARDRYELAEKYENLASARQTVYHSLEKDFEYLPCIDPQVRVKNTDNNWTNPYQQKPHSDNSQKSRSQILSKNGKKRGQAKIIGISRGVETDGNDPVDMFLFEPVPEWVLENSICISFRRKGRFDVACQTGFGKPVKSKQPDNDSASAKDRYKMIYGLDNLNSVPVDNYGVSTSDKQSRNSQCSSESIRILESLANSLVMADEQTEPDTKENHESAMYPSSFQEQSSNIMTKEQDWNANYHSSLPHSNHQSPSSRLQRPDLSHQEEQSHAFNNPKHDYDFPNHSPPEYEFTNRVSSHSVAPGAFGMSNDILLANDHEENIRSSAPTIDNSAYCQANSVTQRFPTDSSRQIAHARHSTNIYQPNQTPPIAGPSKQQLLQKKVTNRSPTELSFTEKLRQLVHKRNTVENFVDDSDIVRSCLENATSLQEMNLLNHETNVAQSHYNVSAYSRSSNDSYRYDAVNNIEQPRIYADKSRVATERSFTDSIADNNGMFVRSGNTGTMDDNRFSPICYSERSYVPGTIAENQQAMRPYDMLSYITPSNRNEKWFDEQPEPLLPAKHPKESLGPCPPGYVLKRKRGRPPKSSPFSNYELKPRPLKPGKMDSSDQPRKKRGRPPKIRSAFQALDPKVDENQNAVFEKDNAVQLPDPKSPVVSSCSDEHVVKDVPKPISDVREEPQMTLHLNEVSQKYFVDSRSSSPVDLLDRGIEKKPRTRTPRRYLKDTVYLDIKESFDRMFSSVGCETMEIVPEDVYYGENYPVIFADDDNVGMKFVDMSLAFKLAMRDVAAKKAKSTELVIPSMGNSNVSQDEQVSHEEQSQVVVQPIKKTLKQIPDRRKRHQKNRDSDSEYSSKQRKLSNSNLDNSTVKSENTESEAKPSHIMSLRPRRSINLGEDYLSSDSFEEDNGSVYESYESSDSEPLINKVSKPSKNICGNTKTDNVKIGSNVISKVTNTSGNSCSDCQFETERYRSKVEPIIGGTNDLSEQRDYATEVSRSLKLAMSLKNEAPEDGKDNAGNKHDKAAEVHKKPLSFGKDKVTDEISASVSEAGEGLETKCSQSIIIADKTGVTTDVSTCNESRPCSVDLNDNITYYKSSNDGASAGFASATSDNHGSAVNQSSISIAKDENAQSVIHHALIVQAVDSAVNGKQVCLNHSCGEDIGLKNNQVIDCCKESDMIDRTKKSLPASNINDSPKQLADIKNDVDESITKYEKPLIQEDPSSEADGGTRSGNFRDVALSNSDNIEQDDVFSEHAEEAEEGDLKQSHSNLNSNLNSDSSELSKFGSDKAISSVEIVECKGEPEEESLLKKNGSECINRSSGMNRLEKKELEGTVHKSTHSVKTNMFLKETSNSINELSKEQFIQAKDNKSCAASFDIYNSADTSVTGGSRISSLIKQSIKAVSNTLLSSRKKNELPVEPNIEESKEIEQRINDKRRELRDIQINTDNNISTAVGNAVEKCRDGVDSEFIQMNRRLMAAHREISDVSVEKTKPEGEDKYHMAKTVAMSTLSGTSHEYFDSFEKNSLTKQSFNEQRYKNSNIDSGSSVSLKQSEPQAGDEAPVCTGPNDADKTRIRSNSIKAFGPLNIVSDQKNTVWNNEAEETKKDFDIDKDIREADKAPHASEVQSRCLGKDNLQTDSSNNARIANNDTVLTANINLYTEDESRSFSADYETELGEKSPEYNFEHTRVLKADEAPDFSNQPSQTSIVDKSEISHNQIVSEGCTVEKRDTIACRVNHSSSRGLTGHKDSETGSLLEKTRNITEIDAAKSLLGLFGSDCGQKDAEAAVFGNVSGKEDIIPGINTVAGEDKVVKDAFLEKNVDISGTGIAESCVGEAADMGAESMVKDRLLTGKASRPVKCVGQSEPYADKILNTGSDDTKVCLVDKPDNDIDIDTKKRKGFECDSTLELEISSTRERRKINEFQMTTEIDESHEALSDESLVKKTKDNDSGLKESGTEEKKGDEVVEEEKNGEIYRKKKGNDNEDVTVKLKEEELRTESEEHKADFSTGKEYLQNSISEEHEREAVDGEISSTKTEENAVMKKSEDSKDDLEVKDGNGLEEEMSKTKTIKTVFQEEASQLTKIDKEDEEQENNEIDDVESKGEEEGQRKKRNCKSEGDSGSERQEESVNGASRRLRRFTSESRDCYSEESELTSSKSDESASQQRGTQSEKEQRRKSDSRKRKSSDMEIADDKPVITRSMRKQNGSPAKRLRSWRS